MQWPSPGSVLQRQLANVLFEWVHFCTCPSFVLLVPNYLLQFLTLDNTLPQYILRKNSAGESHSKKHFESVNVMSREKL